MITAKDFIADLRLRKAVHLLCGIADEYDEELERGWIDADDHQRTISPYVEALDTELDRVRELMGALVDTDR